MVGPVGYRTLPASTSTELKPGGEYIVYLGMPQFVLNWIKIQPDRGDKIAAWLVSRGHNVKISNTAVVEVKDGRGKIVQALAIELKVLAAPLGGSGGSGSRGAN